MSWAEKEVPSLESCKKLKELGFPQEGGGWYWIENKITKEARVVFWDKNFEHYFKENKDFVNIYKAPTCRELGEWLPWYVEACSFMLTFVKEDDNTWWGGYMDENSESKIGHTANTEPNVRAKMIIFLVENGYLRFEK